LPYLEQAGLYQLLDLNISAANQPSVISQRIAVFICPSDPNDKLSSWNPTYPSTYGAAWGDWLAWDAFTARSGNGAFRGGPSQRGVQLLDITDGTSTTVGFAEVKAFGDYLLRYADFVSPPPIPTTPADVLALGGQLSGVVSHTSWARSYISDTGVSFVFPPNTAVLYRSPTDGRICDVDWGNLGYHQYVAITARSFHAGGVNVLFMDGSVRFITNAIPRATWRALGTRNGGEPVAAF
jgi:prepilin-type processing-associated H-X9-DG protein